MKTFQEFKKSGKTLSEYLLLGDEVDKEMVRYFINVYTPAQTATSRLVQMAGGHLKYRNKHGKMERIFATLRKNGGHWYYAGLCFSGESRPAVHHIFMRKRGSHIGNMNWFVNIHDAGCEYLIEPEKRWFYLDLNTQSYGPIYAGTTLHILDENGKQLSQEVALTFDSRLVPFSGTDRRPPEFRV